MFMGRHRQILGNPLEYEAWLDTQRPSPAQQLELEQQAAIQDSEFAELPQDIAKAAELAGSHGRAVLAAFKQLQQDRQAYTRCPATKQTSHTPFETGCLLQGSVSGAQPSPACKPPGEQISGEQQRQPAVRHSPIVLVSLRPCMTP